MFPPNHSLNGFEPKPSSDSAHGAGSGVSSDLVFQNFPPSPSLQTSLPGPLHTTAWMSTNQIRMNSRPWQGPSQQQPTENQHNIRKAQNAHQENDLKHREYLKQQQRLKAMQLSSNKQGVSADALIGNLLEKKDTFAPKPQAVSTHFAERGETSRPNVPVCSGVSNINMNASVTAQIFDDLPVWLNPSSTRLPPIYSHIWSLVCDPASGGKLVDTNKILALLLTSSLPKEILGFIWNLATNGANNQLNQQQLYITLALVALAQMGCTFNNLSVLNYMPQPPIPSFNMNISKVNPDGRPILSDSNMEPASNSCLISPTPVTSVTPLSAATSLPVTSLANSLAPNSVAPSTTLVASNDDDDEFGDFTDYQSAEVITIQPALNLSAASTLPSTAVVQPSSAAKQVISELNHTVSKFGGNHGRSIGSRLANYSLGAPKHHNNNMKHQKSSFEHDNLYMDDEVTFANVAKDAEQKQHSQLSDTTESDEFSDFQIAAGLNVNVDELFPKCNPKGKKQKVVLKESAIRSSSDDEELKDGQKFGELLSLDASSNSSPSVAKDIPVIPPPAKATKELMSVEEDKYSALRFIEVETKPAVVAAPENIGPSESDDFGDFVSADDLFAEIAVRDTMNQNNPVKLAQDVDWLTPSKQAFEFPVTDWEGQNCHQLTSPPQENLSHDSSVLSSAVNVDDALSSALSSLDFCKGSGSSLPKPEEALEWSFDFNIGQHSSNKNLGSTTIECTRQEDDEFGDFVGPQTPPTEDLRGKSSTVFLNDQSWVEESSNKQGLGLLSDNRSVSSLELPVVPLSRHGSLPSLDLNLFPVNDDPSEKINSSQMSDWIRCLESCLSLLQSAATTFSSISSQSVLMEVLNAPEGRSYLSNLLEAHRVSWRIRRSLQRSGHDSNQAESVLLSIDRAWSTLKTFYSLANIETALEKDGSDEESGQPACGVCGSPASRGVLEYGGHAYHAPCANLWVNCVDRTLPGYASIL